MFLIWSHTLEVHKRKHLWKRESSGKFGFLVRKKGIPDFEVQIHGVFNCDILRWTILLCGMIIICDTKYLRPQSFSNSAIQAAFSLWSHVYFNCWICYECAAIPAGFGNSGAFTSGQIFRGSTEFEKSSSAAGSEDRWPRNNSRRFGGLVGNSFPAGI